jgi:hypothetical protein
MCRLLIGASLFVEHHAIAFSIAIPKTKVEMASINATPFASISFRKESKLILPTHIHQKTTNDHITIVT